MTSSAALAAQHSQRRTSSDGPLTRFPPRNFPRYARRRWRNQMAAVMTTPRFDPRYSTEEDSRSIDLTLVPTPAEGVGRTPRISATTYWRRRLAVLVGVLMVVLVAGQAGAALRSSPLAAPARPPSV